MAVLSGGGGDGGGGGMDFVGLGDKIHKNTLATMDWFKNTELEKKAARRQAMLDIEDKRRFGAGLYEQQRETNAGMLGLLNQQRQAAESQARTRTFANLLTQ